MGRDGGVGRGLGVIVGQSSYSLHLSFLRLCLPHQRQFHCLRQRRKRPNKWSVVWLGFAVPMISVIDGIEEHDHFSPISRCSSEPTRVGSLRSGMVIGKESNLSGVVNGSGLHIKVGPTNRRRIRHLDVSFIDLAGANNDATLGDATAHHGAEGNLIRIIDIGNRTKGDKRSVLEAEALSA